MDQNAQNIINRYQECKLVSKFSDLKLTIENEKGFSIIVFKVYEFLKQNDELPHNWGVTSDSIACFIASKMNLKNCFLIKDIDGIYAGGKTFIKELTLLEYSMLIAKNLLYDPNISEGDSIISDLKKKNTPIDSYLTFLIPEFDINCIILNGKSGTSRIVDYFQLKSDSERVYTKIHL